MLFKIIMMLVFYSCILIMYVMYFNETKPKKNIILGTTIPVSHVNDEKVKKIVKDYKKLSTYVFIALTIILIPCAFMSMSMNLCYSMTWMVVGIIVQTLPYIRANKQLRKFKAENNLHGTSGNVVDLKLSVVEIKTTSPLLSLIPFAISLVPIMYILVKKPSTEYMDFLVPLLILSATILLCMGMHIVINKRKNDVVSDNTDINYALSTIRSKNWARAFIGLNFLVSATNILIFLDFTLDKFNGSVFFVLIMVLSLLSVIYAMYIEFDTRKKQFKYTTENLLKQDLFLDEDDYWIWGLFYYNPKDNRLIIPDRVGSNTGVNMAKPAGKILMVICGLLIAAMPFLGGYFVVADKTPMTVKFTDTAIIATHMSEDYNIPRVDITEMVETKECPKLTSKVNGWGTDTICKGTFRVKDYGTCQVFIPSYATQFYIIKTTDGTTYILGK